MGPTVKPSSLCKATFHFWEGNQLLKVNQIIIWIIKYLGILQNFILFYFLQKQTFKAHSLHFIQHDHLVKPKAEQSRKNPNYYHILNKHVTIILRYILALNYSLPGAVTALVLNNSLGVSREMEEARFIFL